MKNFRNSDMRKEFMKDDTFKSPDIASPPEFDITDYDTAKKSAPERVDTPETNETQPQVKNHPRPTQEGTPNDHTPLAETEPQPQPTQTSKERISREVINLDSGLNGPAWEFKEMHGRRLRVRTTWIHEKQEAPYDSWDNTFSIRESNIPEKVPATVSLVLLSISSIFTLKFLNTSIIYSICMFVATPSLACFLSVSVTSSKSTILPSPS